jgi:hypothetical protein
MRRFIPPAHAQTVLAKKSATAWPRGETCLAQCLLEMQAYIAPLGLASIQRTSHLSSQLRIVTLPALVEDSASLMSVTIAVQNVTSKALYVGFTSILPPSKWWNSCLTSPRRFLGATPCLPCPSWFGCRHDVPPPPQYPLTQVQRQSLRLAPITQCPNSPSLIEDVLHIF